MVCDRLPLVTTAMLAFAKERNPGQSLSEEKSETREADRIASPSEAANPTFEDFLIVAHPSRYKMAEIIGQQLCFP
jgi:hypothetical protein